MPMPILTPLDLKTISLRVEPLSPHHAAALLEPLQDQALYEYIPDRRPADRAALEARFERLAAGSPRPDEGWLNWVAFCGEAPVAMLQATVEGDRATIGYVVLQTWWGQGVGRAGMSWLQQELLVRRGLAVVRAFIDPRNTRSLRLVEGAGFTELPSSEHPADTPPGDRVFERWA